MSSIHCPHKEQDPGGRVCAHLLKEKDASYAHLFPGTGLNYDLICWKCQRDADKIKPALVEICSDCFCAIEADGSWEGIVGKPEVLIRPSNLRFEHEEFGLPELKGVRILEVQPVEGSAGKWLACSSTGTFLKIIPAEHSVHAVAQLTRDDLDFDGVTIRGSQHTCVKAPPCMLHVSRTGELVAVANRYGEKGVVLSLATGKVTMRLLRGRYHEDVSMFPLAFVHQGDTVLLIHGTAWNRLDVSNARTGTLLSERGATSYKRGEVRPEHYLDYFHCLLLLSPDQQYVVDNGWVWHPSGRVDCWNMCRWLNENVWESEDGESKKSLCWRSYYWDGPLCWIDNHRLAVWGYGQDDEWLIG